LALAGVGKHDSWEAVKRPSLRIHDILLFAESKYRQKYAENTRETIRRQVIHQFEQAGIVDRNPDDPALPTNSPRTHYALTGEVMTLVQTWGTELWQDNLASFLAKRTTLLDIYSRKRKARMIPVKISSGKELKLTPGKHNRLQAAIIKEFAPRFAPGADLLYFGDTARKFLHFDPKALEELSIPVTEHGKLPDVILYHRDTDCLFLIEAVTSHGLVSPKRRYELEQVFLKTRSRCIYVSAFPDFKEFKKHIDNIAWETEVWISDIPDHLIHFNADKFLR